jgi:hypothetical protein
MPPKPHSVAAAPQVVLPRLALGAGLAAHRWLPLASSAVFCLLAQHYQIGSKPYSSR